MNYAFVQSLKQLVDQDDTIKTDLFGYDVVRGTSYLPQTLHIDVSSSSIRDSTVVYSFNINDRVIHSLNNFVFSFETAEVFSDKQIAFVPHFGFKIIRKVEIFDNEECIMSVDGPTIFSRASRKFKNLETSGHSKNLNDFNLSIMENLSNMKKYFLPASSINVPLELFNPEVDTFSTIRNGTDSCLRVEVTVLKNLMDVMVYNPGAVLKFALDRPVPLPFKIKRPILTATAYAVESIENEKPIKYTISCEEIQGELSEDESFASEVNNVTHVNFSVGNDLSGKRFFVWAGYDQSEEHWVKLYLNKLLKEALVIVPEDEDPNNSPHVSPKAHYVKVVDNKVALGTVKTIDIWVEKVPKKFDVWVHMNPLVFRANKVQIEYNILEKINSVYCTWNSFRNDFIFHDIDHQLDIGDVSIPLDIWDVQTLSSDGDNRSEFNKQTDVIINDPFLRGIDLLNKQNPVDMVTISQGNETLYQTHLDTSYYFPDHASRITFPFLHKGYGNFSFGFHSDPSICPNYLPADHVRGKTRIGVKFNWKVYDMQNPRFHIGKKVIIQYGTVHEVSTSENRNKVTVLNKKR